MQKFDPPTQSQNELPLIVDLDDTFLKVDTLYERFVTALFNMPLQAVMSLATILKGKAAFKRRVSEFAPLDVTTLPTRDDLVAYIKQAAAHGRAVHLATASDHISAEKIASQFDFFSSVHASDGVINLKGCIKGERLASMFPGGFVYAGDSWADLPVWQRAQGAIVVSSNAKLHKAVQSSGVSIERWFKPRRAGLSSWLRAARPHQWSKNLIVLVPLILGWRDVSLNAFMATLAMVGLLCIAASLTYMVNDLADLAADRRHWSKRRRPFASGAIAVRDGLLLVTLSLPITCLAALIVAPLAGLCLLCYIAITLAYSFGLKKIPVFDTFVIGLLFTIRILIGMTAAKLDPSIWLLTFSMFFFFSLALAKRHTEIVRATEHDILKLDGRGYQVGDQALTLAFGLSAAMASILIVVIYLVEEVFAHQMYATPAWLWATPIAIFLFVCRIWVLSHRGRMTDDPVAFALRDRVSVGLGVLVATAILLAL